MLKGLSRHRAVIPAGVGFRRIPCDCNVQWILSSMIDYMKPYYIYSLYIKVIIYIRPLRQFLGDLA